MTVFIDEDATQKESQVLDPVVFQTVRKKIVDIDDPKISTKWVLFHITHLVHHMTLVKGKDIGMHVKDQGITRKNDLRLELPSVLEFDDHVIVDITDVVIELSGDLLKGGFQLLENRKCVSINELFCGGFLRQNIQDLLIAVGFRSFVHINTPWQR